MKPALLIHFINYGTVSRLVMMAMLGILFIAVAACTDNANDSDLLHNGSFEARVTGSHFLNFTGESLYGVQVLENPNRKIFVLHNTAEVGDKTLEINVRMYVNSRPEIGVYPLGGNSSLVTAEYIYTEEEQTPIRFFPENGNMRITTSTARGIEGRISFIGRTGNQRQEVAVSATFNASCGPSTVTFCE